MTESLNFDLDGEELEVFCLEADELVQQLDSGLLLLEQGEAGPEVIQQVFRAAHTLKGSGGAIGHTRLANLTHSMETVLDLVRTGRIDVTSSLVDALLGAVDALRSLIQEVVTRQHSGVQPQALIQQLQALAVSAAAPGAALDKKGAASESGATPAIPSTSPKASVLVHVSATIAADSIAPAARAYQVLMALESLGQIVWSDPSREAIERNDPVGVFQVLVSTTRPPVDLRDALQYIGDLSTVDVAVQAAVSEEPSSVVEEGEEPAGEATAVEPTAGRTADVKEGVARNRQAPGSKTDVKTVRTSVERLDKLMNLVGELVTDRNRLMQTHARLAAQYQEDDTLGELAQAISHVASITDELQEEVMRARMLPLEHVFNKFPRMVRDLAREMGKTVTFEIQGQDTELDRSVIEEISDPLMHLLRNAVDHGIEGAADRRAAGKPETGTIRLAGRSEGNHIVITVSDDGNGIAVERVRQSAVSKGLITAEAAERLSESEALDLIFLPGLSTAKRLTDVSGRGVGMDVVRTNIERLHGTVQVETKAGQGTIFELRLPLTLAIMPVLLVALCKDTYCIPLSSVTEVLLIDPATAHRVGRGELVMWRAKTLPLLHLDQLFGLRYAVGSVGTAAARAATESFAVVAARWGDEHVGLVVDGFLGQQEIVIKNLGYMIGQTAGISGATILGDGTVALILDVPGLVKQVSRQ